jgi:membrane-bound lytic murein transglycosylase D
MYVFEFHKEHGIKPNKAVVNHFETDTIMVKNKMTFKQLSDLLSISVEQLRFLNPQYKRDFVPYITNKKHFVRLPIDKVAVFTSNESKIYAYTEYDFNKREKPFTASEAYVSEGMVSKTKYHKVRKGESLGGISKKYGVTISELKKWNKLKSNKVVTGKSLKIITDEAVAIAPKKTADKSVAISNDTIKSKSEEDKDSTKFHLVERGENLYSIAQKYSATKEDLKEWNNLKDEDIQLGSKLLVSEAINQEKTENYVVQSGDNLSTIAKKYGVGIDDIKKWNNLEDYNVKLGSTLKIIVSEKEEIVTEVKTQKPEKHSTFNKEDIYIVKKGDSLFSISKKIKGVTVSDLKKWNGISGGNIKPGMKLKISG